MTTTTANVADDPNAAVQALTRVLMTPIPNQFDMIAGCRLCLAEHGVSAEQLAFYDNDPTLNASKSLSEYAQRTALNQFWHLQMGPFGGLSHTQRFKLIDTGTASDWFKLFVNGPVQFIADHNLPKLH